MPEYSWLEIRTKNETKGLAKDSQAIYFHSTEFTFSSSLVDDTY